MYSPVLLRQPYVMFQSEFQLPSFWSTSVDVYQHPQMASDFRLSRI